MGKNIRSQQSYELHRNRSTHSTSTPTGERILIKYKNPSKWVRKDVRASPLTHPRASHRRCVDKQTFADIIAGTVTPTCTHTRAVAVTTPRITLTRSCWWCQTAWVRSSVSAAVQCQSVMTEGEVKQGIRKPPGGNIVKMYASFILYFRASGDFTINSFFRQNKQKTGNLTLCFLSKLLYIFCSHNLSFIWSS